MSRPDTTPEGPQFETERPEPASDASKPPRPAPPEDAAAASDSRELSAEEQMARYEESLKNDDWGHQPC